MMTEQEQQITKAYYQYTNRGWPNQKPWEQLGDGAKSIWKDRAMRAYKEEQRDKDR
jgi:hypothetical protein